MTDYASRLPHRLAVLWFADLVGWSRLTSIDEDRAIAQVRRFQAAVRAVVPLSGGRVVKFIGDAALVESPSAESAVQSAAAIRDAMGEGDAIRAGIHLGDVAVAPDGDLYGDGVNTAQRIQTAADPGQIVVSGPVWQQLRNRPAFRLEPLGERELKGVAPVALYRLDGIAGFGEPVRSEPAAAPAARSAAPVALSATATAEPRIDERRSVAVLPFTNLSAQAENEFFSDGMTDTILTSLTRIGGLKVISRTSVMRYKGTTKSVREIADELDVATVLEGSVQRAGERVRITAQLIDARTDEHLWADTYDRTLEDIFAIQSEVAERIASELTETLTPAERARLETRPTESVTAWRLYSEGRQLLGQRTGGSMKAAVERFRAAIAEDPAFALAWNGVAEGLALLASYGFLATEAAHSEGRAAAERAIALDPGLGEPHCALGFMAASEWRWEEAERHYRRGLELSPGYATGHHWLGNYLLSTGRLDEARQALDRAAALDPLWIPIRMAAGVLHIARGEYDRAAESYSQGLELEPGHAGLRFNLATLYRRRGQFEAAIRESREVSRQAPDMVSPEEVANLQAGYEAGGPRGFYEADYAWSLAHEEAHWRHLTLAGDCLELGRIDEALDWIERAVDAREAVIVQVVQSPDFWPLRSEPRFAALVRRMGLDPDRLPPVPTLDPPAGTSPG